ncbi:HNH endonuclease [Glutamicibacter sp.]|uniref:HNH endonuclease n=1 Tax=Glutamicibacter sp. TaxID=1931995 RepID=UPI0028BED4DD|nr:HNH endonuclease [Glutamicibacter sp.]
MSEAMALRHRPPQTPLQRRLTELRQEVHALTMELLEAGDATDLLGGVNELQSTIAAFHYLQAALSHQAEKRICYDHEERGVHIDYPATGAASSVALARRQAPQGFMAKLAGYRILFEDTPNLAGTYATGALDEDRIDIVLTELGRVKAAQRQDFDVFYGENPDLFTNKGPGKVRETVREFTLPLMDDDEAVKLQDAADKQYVRFYRDGASIRFSGSLPSVLGVALREHLRHESFQAKQQGDPRTRAQIEASALVGNLVAGQHRKLPLRLNLSLIMTDRSLFMGKKQPAYLEGYGYISSQVARELVAGSFDGVGTDIRKLREGEYQDYLENLETVTEMVRLYTAPGGSELVAMDSKARLFPPKLKRFIRVRDRNCRTPFCDGMATEADHIVQHHLGGATDADNSAGRCPICNKAKEKWGWNEYVGLAHPQTMVIENAGMRFVSQAPPVSGYVQAVFPELKVRHGWWRAVQERLNDAA